MGLYYERRVPHWMKQERMKKKTVLLYLQACHRVFTFSIFSFQKIQNENTKNGFILF